MHETHVEVAIRTALADLGISTVNVSISTVRTRDGFFNVVDNIWPQIQDDPEKVTVLAVDRTDWDLQDNWSIDDLELGAVWSVLEDYLRGLRDTFEQLPMDQLPAAIAALDPSLDRDDYQYEFDPETESESEKVASVTEDALADLGSTLENMAFSTLRTRHYDLYAALRQAIDDNLNELSDDDCDTLFGEDRDADGLDRLAYWTRYFAPDRMDAKIAVQCGLIPFRFDNEDGDSVELLALGGSGMDLSPKLDAYQALVDSSVPTDSKFHSSREYFAGVVGQVMTDLVLDKTTTPPVITVITRDQEPNDAPRTYVVDHGCSHVDTWTVPATEPVFTGYKTEPRPNTCPSCGRQRTIESVKLGTTNR